MVVLTLLTYMPVLVCLLWLFNHTLFVSSTKTFPVMVCLLIVMLLYTFTDCAYGDPNASDSLLLATSNMAQLVAPCVLPLTIMYLRKLRTGEDIKFHQLIWIVLPVALFTSVVMITLLAGPRQLESFLSRLYAEGPSVMENYSAQGVAFMYFFNSSIIFRVVLGLELIGLIISYITAWREGDFKPKRYFDFLLHKGKINIVELQYYNLTPLILFTILKIFIFRNVLITNTWLPPTMSFLFALVLSPFSYTAMFGAKKTLTMRELALAFRYNYTPETIRSVYNEAVWNFLNEFGDEGEEFLHSASLLEDRRPEPESRETFSQEMGLAETLFSNIQRTWDKDSLMGRFEHLMMEEKAFLQPGLMLADVAESLGTNKTYISRLVNSTYKMSFPDLVNFLRIDYAEEYLIAHRGAKQAEIATACGFPSASSLNITFKKVTGMTPRIWQTTHDRANEKR